MKQEQEHFRVSMKPTSDPDEKIVTGDMRDMTESITCQKRASEREKRPSKKKSKMALYVKKKSHK